MCVCAAAVGRQAVALVREFLEFFELDFTTAVFDPETNAVSVCVESEKWVVSTTHNMRCIIIGIYMTL